LQNYFICKQLKLNLKEKIMNYQIADAKTKFFDDKEHYLNFLQAWKKAAQRSQSKGEGWGCLTGAHMFFYAAVRGRNVYEAFTPIHRKTKLQNGFRVNQGMYFAYDWLSRLARYAKDDNYKWGQEMVEEFLKPFNGTIDKERFVKIVEAFPEVEPLYSDYGKGSLAAAALLETTESDLWSVIERALKESTTLVGVGVPKEAA
jgi:hypothetical protein